MAGLSDLCFKRGLEFAKLVRERFNRPVSPSLPNSPGSFRLVASFGRSSIRLNPDSVGLLLQSCLGGSAPDFNVAHLSGWMYAFSVSCKEVGFLIYRSYNYSCKSFAIFFHLWGNGGPNWIRDFKVWCNEQSDEWSTVGPKGKILKNKKSFADAVRTHQNLSDKKILHPRPRISAFARLKFPENYLVNSAPKHFDGKRKLHSRKSVLRWQLKRLTAVTNVGKLASKTAAPFASANPNLNSKSPSMNRAKAQSSLFEQPPRPSMEQAQQMPKAQPASSNALALIRKQGRALERCTICFNYGHSADFCHHKSRLLRRYRPICRIEYQEASRSSINAHPRLSPEGSFTAPPTSPQATVPLPTSLPSPSIPMANWSVDPTPFVPKGFTLVERAPHPPRRSEVFVAGCFSQHNEDLAIVKLQPPVHNADFPILQSALREYFLNVHEVHVHEVRPCPLGAAYVRFATSLEREKFLGRVFRFRNSYDMMLVKHDEADNARTFDLDKEVWVLMLGFPEDLKTDNVVAKSVSDYGIMADWIGINLLGIVVAKVYINDSAKIPDSTKINAGIPPKGHSWTTPVFLLKQTDVVLPQDEEGFVTFGPLHPVPPSPPRWMGDGPGANSTDSSNSNSSGGNDNSTMAAGGSSGFVASDRWAMHTAPEFRVNSPMENIDMQVVQQNLSAHNIGSSSMVMGSTSSQALPRPALRSVVFGPELAKEPMVTVIPSLVRQVMNFIHATPSSIFLRFVTLIDIDDSTIIPAYFNDPLLLIRIASISDPQLVEGNETLEQLARSYNLLDDSDDEGEKQEPSVDVEMEDGEEDTEDVVNALVPLKGKEPLIPQENDSDLEMLDDAPLIFQTPEKSKKKKKVMGIEELLEDSFFRRSKRVANRLSGFKNEESAKAHAENSEPKMPGGPSAAKKPKSKKRPRNTAGTQDEAMDVQPLAMIPPSPGIAPHLPRQVLSAIGEDYLEIQPEAVSAALLEVDDIDE